MAKIDVNEVQGLFRVGITSDSKGNDVYALEILGVPVAYADAHEFEADRLDCEDWQDVFAARFGRLMLKALTDGYEDTVRWRPESPTGREALRLGPFREDW